MPALAHLLVRALVARGEQVSENPPKSASHPSGTHMGNTPSPKKHEEPGMSGGAIAAIVIFVLLLVAGVAYVAYSVLRARRLGLPTPTWRHFIPFVPNNKRTAAASTSYEPTRPAGGVFGRVKGVFGGGGNGGDGYSGTNTRSARTRAMDPDQQAWDTRIDEHDNEDDTAYKGAGGRYDGYDAPMEIERGRSRSRDPPRTMTASLAPYPEDDHAGIPVPAGSNPFDRDVARVKADGFGDVGLRGGRPSTDSERRSVFKEGI